MLINTITPTNFSMREKDNLSFKQNLFRQAYQIPTLSFDHIKTLSNLEVIYNQIQDVLSRKTHQGLNNIIREHKGFNTVDGLTFKNFSDDTTLSFEVKKSKDYSKFIKLILRNRDKEVIDGYLIKNNGAVVSNYDLKNPNKIPDLLGYFSSEDLKEIGLEQKISKILDRLDELMFDVRMFVLKRKDNDIRLPDGFMGYDLQRSLSSIVNRTLNIDEITKSLSPITLNRYKSNFPDYCFKEGLVANKFKNLGPNNERISFSTVNNTAYGRLSKLMVYNEDDSVKTGYLIKDGKFVSNFNPKNSLYIPEKLLFASVDDLKSEYYSVDFAKYLDLYETKLSEYFDYMSKVKRTGLGALPVDKVDSMKKLGEAYMEVNDFLSKYSLTTINKIKGEYPDFDLTVPKRGYTFSNVGPDLKTINILKMKSQNDENVYKIGLINKDGNTETEIMVKNFNQLANSYKISEDQVLAKLEILNYLEDIISKFKDFNQFMVERENRLKSRKTSPKLADAIDSVKVVKSKPIKVRIPKEQKQEFKRTFNEMLSNFKGDLSDFDSCVAKIREQLSQLMNSSVDN